MGNVKKVDSWTIVLHMEDGSECDFWIDDFVITESINLLIESKYDVTWGEVPKRKMTKQECIKMIDNETLCEEKILRRMKVGK